MDTTFRVVRLLFENLDFYATIHLTMLFRVVRHDGIQLAMPLRKDSRPIDSAFDHLLTHTMCTALSQTLIIGIRSYIIGVANDLDA